MISKLIIDSFEIIIYPDSKFPACCYQFDKNALLEFPSLLRKAASDFAYDIAGNVCHDMLFIASY